MQDKTPFWMNGSADQHVLGGQGAGMIFDAQLLKDIAKSDIRAAIDEDAHGTLRIVSAEQRDTAAEVRIFQCGDGDQEVVAEIGLRHAGSVYVDGRANDGPGATFY